jgi:hypothetical protein
MRLAARPSLLAAARAMKNGQAVVEAGFDVECLADAHWHTRTVHNDLTEASISRSEHGAKDSGFPIRQLWKTEARSDCTKQDGQEHPRA